MRRFGRRVRRRSRNTERQGEQAVSQIDAQTRLAMAQMQARAQAAQLAAAKAAAAKKAADGKLGKLSGTDLEAMLTNAVNARMGQSLSSGAQLVGENEQKKSQNVAINDLGAISSPSEGVTWPAPKTARATPVNGSQWPVEAPPGASPVGAPPPQPQERDGESMRSFQNRYAAWQKQMAAWQAAVGTTQRKPPITAPGAGTAAAMVGGSIGSLEGIGASVMPASVNYQAPVPRPTMNVGGNVGSLEGIAMAAQQQTNAYGQAAQVAARRSAVTPSSVQARGAQEQAGLMDLTRQMQAPFQSQFGNISEDQMRWIANTDPFLATLFANSPEQVTSQNYGRLFAGEPDRYNQPSQYSMDAMGLARQLARQDLMKAGYDISDADFANATTPKMQTGESYAQYIARIGGQVNSLDRRKIDQSDPNYRSDREKLNDAMADTRFQAWLDDRAHDKAKEELTDDEFIMEHQNYLNTHNPDGSDKLDENGYPISLSPASRQTSATAAGTAAAKEGDRLNDQAAREELLKSLPRIPDTSKYGNEATIYRTLYPENGKVASDGKTPVFGAIVQGMQALPGAYTGWSADDFTKAVGSADDPASLWGLWDQLTPAQKAILRDLFYDKSKDPPVKAPK